MPSRALLRAEQGDMMGLSPGCGSDYANSQASSNFRFYFRAVRSQWVGDFPVLDAALLLEELGPACPVSCEDAVRALLPEWDVSIEQVPFYLAARFGPARVHQAIAKLRPEVTEKNQQGNLDTVAYWVHVYDGTWPPNKS